MCSSLAMMLCVFFFFTTGQIRGSLNTSGQIADAQKPAWRQSLGQLLEKAVFLSTPEADL